MRLVFRWFREAVRTHPFNFLTLVIALAAAAFTAWGAFEARRQAEEARLARVEAAAASAAQKMDVERSRIAAERSRDAAERLASATQNISESSERTAKAAETSTTFSAQQLRAALEGLVAQQRPALEITAFKLSGDMGVAINLTLKNSGHSPAQNVRTEAKVEIGSSRTVDFEKKADVPFGPIGYQPDIPSGSEAWTNVLVPSSERMTQCCKYQRGDIIRVVGIVYYTDFDKRQFTLPFCYEVDRSFAEMAPAFGIPPIMADLRQCVMSESHEGAQGRTN